MTKKQFITFNPYFFYPFFIWIIAAGALQFFFTKEELFRVVNTNSNAIIDSFIYYITWIGQAEIIIPVLLFLFIYNEYRTWWYFVTALLCNIIPFFLQQLLKFYYDEPRPINYFHNAQWIHYVTGWPVLYNRSFPSGHTEGAFRLLCFLSFLLPVNKRKYGLLFFFIALFVGYSRIYLTAHFFEDVYVGSLVGVLTTTIFYAIMIPYKKQRKHLQ